MQKEVRAARSACCSPRAAPAPARSRRLDARASRLSHCARSWGRHEACSASAQMPTEFTSHQLNAIIGPLSNLHNAASSPLTDVSATQKLQMLYHHSSYSAYQDPKRRLRATLRCLHSLDEKQRNNCFIWSKLPLHSVTKKYILKQTLPAHISKHPKVLVDFLRHRIMNLTFINIALNID